MLLKTIGSTLSLCALSGALLFGQNPATPAVAEKPAAPAPKPAPAFKSEKAAAYYHYSLGHYYEDQMMVQGMGEGRIQLNGDVSRALDEYKLAAQLDPGNSFLQSELAESYLRGGRIREAVETAEQLLQRDPNNVEAHRLLGRIYLRSLGDAQQNASSSLLKKAIDQFQQIVRLEPKNVEDHLLLGRLYRLSGDLLKAEEEFKTSVKLNPNSEEAVTSLAYLYNEEGDSTRAIKTLAAVADEAQSSRLYAALGYTYEQQKDYKGAISAYRKSLELDKENLDSMRGLAQNLINDGQYDAALQTYKQIADADPQDAQALMRMSDIYRRTGKFNEALAVLKKASGLVEDSLEIPYNMALVYEAKGDYANATQLLQGLVKRTDKVGAPTQGDRNNRAVFLERLGSIYREQNKTDLAVATFQSMVDLGGDNASRGYMQIVECYRDAKQWQKAADTAREAAQKFPNDRQVKITLASQLADLGKGDDAVSIMKSLLKNSKEDRETWISLAQVQSRMRRFADSEESLAQAEKLSAKSDDRDYLEFVKGSIYEREKKYEAAEQSFRLVVKNDPHNAMALNYLGYMLADHSQKLEDALGYIKRAIELDPENGAYLDSLGWAYFKLGNYEMAEENLRRANEKVGNDGTVQDHLAELYAKTGRLRQAAAHWDRALAEWNNAAPADVDQDDVARVQRKLESARVKLAREQSAK